VHEREDQALFGIVQGGTNPELRGESAAATAALGFPGFALGGLSVGETADARAAAIEAAVAELPPDKPRYVMGLGDAGGVVEAVARGIDLFDCVWPTRLARHGRVLTDGESFNIKRAEFTGDDAPLSDDCACLTCSRYSRAYLRHLKITDELLAYRLLSLHNLHYTLRLMERIRLAIGEGRLGEMMSERS
jgi:queuine tRNA-ribosyltransferase